MFNLSDFKDFSFMSYAKNVTDSTCVFEHLSGINYVALLFIPAWGDYLGGFKRDDLSV